MECVCHKPRGFVWRFVPADYPPPYCPACPNLDGRRFSIEPPALCAHCLRLIRRGVMREVGGVLHLYCVDCQGSIRG